MNITSVKHQKYNDELSDVVKATIDGQEMFIPKDEGNRHWVAIQAWVADGNTIEEAG
tara:strand:+ start:660 stop:830 length:171 start_codon:yes stop_codon:yes gene_type:complete